MRAVKGNRSYTISELDKDRFIKEGYDIINDKGKIVAYGAGKTVPYEQYAKVVAELEALKAKDKATDKAKDKTE